MDAGLAVLIPLTATRIVRTKIKLMYNNDENLAAQMQV